MFHSKFPHTSISCYDKDIRNWITFLLKYLNIGEEKNLQHIPDIQDYKCLFSNQPESNCSFTQHFFQEVYSIECKLESISIIICLDAQKNHRNNPKYM